MSKQTGKTSKQLAFLLAEITEMSKQTGKTSKQFAFLLIKSLITDSELFLGLTHCLYTLCENGATTGGLPLPLMN